MSKNRTSKRIRTLFVPPTRKLSPRLQLQEVKVMTLCTRCPLPSAEKVYYKKVDTCMHVYRRIKTNGKNKNKLIGLFSLVPPNYRSDTLHLRLYIYIPSSILSQDKRAVCFRNQPQPPCVPKKLKTECISSINAKYVDYKRQTNVHSARKK